MLNQTENKTPVNKSNGRKILLGLAVIFVLPFTIAKTMHLLNVHPTSHSYGTLINPPRALIFATLKDTQGGEVKPQQWLKIWSIVTTDTTGCSQACQAQVHLLKQVHTALDKDIKRVQRVLIAPTIKADTASALHKQYPDLIILGTADAQSLQFAAKFNADEITTAPSKGGVYLVDPLGNLMMTYPADMNPKGMLTDLKKLLKNSWAG